MLAMDRCLQLLAAVDGGETVPTPLLPELGRYGQGLRRVYSVTTVLKQRLDRVWPTCTVSSLLRLFP
jgi:hypothetical protein